MAKIYLRGEDTAILVSSQEAERVNNDWIANPNSNDIVMVGSETFKLRDIKRISGVGIDKDESNKYNLDNPNNREIIKQFEKEFLAWYENNKDVKYPPPKFERWFAELGAIRIEDGDEFGRIIIVDPVLYTDLSEKWNALQYLRRRRTMAKQIDKEDFNSLMENEPTN